VAIRDKETRLYFAGYKPYAYKVFAFAVGAMLAGLGGALYPAQVGIVTPQDMNTEASILMVIWVAAGGRGRLWGAVYGAILVNVLKSSLSSDLPSLWPFVEGGIFVAVVLFFPEGFVGIWGKLEERVKVRAGAARIATTIFPLFIVSLFVLLEALGLQPPFLQHTISIPLLGSPVQWKYILLIVLLIANTAAFISQKRQDQALRSRPGFTPAPATTAGRIA